MSRWRVRLAARSGQLLVHALVQVNATVKPTRVFLRQDVEANVARRTKAARLRQRAGRT